MAKYDYGEDGKVEGPTDAQLSRISKLAAELVDQQERVSEFEEKLKAEKEKLNGIAERELPEAMSDIHMKRFSLEDGSEVAVSDIVRCGALKSEEGLQYVIDEGDEQLIKATVTIAFGNDEMKRAQRFANAMQILLDRPVTLERSVHAQTLKGYVNERLRELEDDEVEDARDFDPTRVGAHIVTVAKVKPPKKKATKSRRKNDG